ncbi:DUF6221 family protein [Streptomyces tendae]|uniref:DUF6221 family protein n=1 Tax=Streptomyces tendae TaxID=1932 RepID=UPI0033DB1DBE
MTAQGEDLLAWLDRAITARENVAREACDGGEGRWHNGWCPEGDLEEGETDSGCGVSDERDRTVVYDEGRPNKAQSVHIAANDPASVLRCCVADRKLLTLHSPVILHVGGGAKYFETTKVCKSCEPPIQFPETSYPCPTIVALAEGYGWTAGQTPPTEGDQVT